MRDLLDSHERRELERSEEQHRAVEREFVLEDWRDSVAGKIVGKDHAQASSAGDVVNVLERERVHTKCFRQRWNCGGG